MTDKKLVCKYCHEYASSALWLNNGFKERTFKTEQALASHLRTHDEENCPLCGKYGHPSGCSGHFA